LARKAKEPLEPLDLADGSVDFITASMLIYQFEAEPYRYFSNFAGENLGAPSAAEENRLNGSMEALQIGSVDHTDRSVRAGNSSPTGTQWPMLAKLRDAPQRRKPGRLVFRPSYGGGTATICGTISF
jgi:hypothetical protein